MKEVYLVIYGTITCHRPIRTETHIVAVATTHEMAVQLAAVDACERNAPLSNEVRKQLTENNEAWEGDAYYRIESYKTDTL